MHVRLKSDQPLKRFNFEGKLYQEERGWHLVSDAVAAKLAKVHSVPDDPSTPLAFDVKTEAEAMAIEEEELRRVVSSQRSTVGRPIDYSGGGESSMIMPEDLKRGTSRASKGARA